MTVLQAPGTTLDAGSSPAPATGSNTNGAKKATSMGQQTVYRMGWHAGFGGTGTADTLHPAQFLRELKEKFGHLDSSEVFGAYQVPGDKIPDDLERIPRQCYPAAQAPQQGELPMLTFKELLSKLTDDELAELDSYLLGDISAMAVVMAHEEPYLVRRMNVVYAEVTKVRLDVLNVIADRYESVVTA